MNTFGLGWCDLALRLEDELRTAYALRDEVVEENREIRSLLSNLLLAIGRNADLLRFARGELDDYDGHLHHQPIADPPGRPTRKEAAS